MVTLRQKVFLASRPFGRGDDTPRRESPEGAPNAVAIKRAGAGWAVGWVACGVVLGWGAASLHLAAALLDLVRR